MAQTTKTFFIISLIINCEYFKIGKINNFYSKNYWNYYGAGFGSVQTIIISKERNRGEFGLCVMKRRSTYVPDDVYDMVSSLL